MILVPAEKIADYTRRGWWGTQTLWDLFVRHRDERPHDEAVVDAPNRAEFAHGAPRRLGWLDLSHEVDRLCLVLLDQGIRRDDIVVMMLPNCTEQFAVYLACLRLGVVVTPVPVQYREHELAHILATTSAVISITAIPRRGDARRVAALAERLEAAHPSVPLAVGGRFQHLAPPGTRQLGHRIAAAAQDVARSIAAP